jgi:hypothetical protein
MNEWTLAKTTFFASRPGQPKASIPRNSLRRVPTLAKTTLLASRLG